MNCPHCHKPIDDTALAAHLAAKGGRKSKRTITPEQRRKMQEAKEAKRRQKGGGA